MPASSGKTSRRGGVPPAVPALQSPRAVAGRTAPSAPTSARSANGHAPTATTSRIAVVSRPRSRRPTTRRTDPVRVRREGPAPAGAGPSRVPPSTGDLCRQVAVVGPPRQDLVGRQLLELAAACARLDLGP